MASNNISDEKGEPAMGMLRVISKHGDDRVQWNEHDVQVGDAEAMAAIREAERIFAQQRARGATAFRVEAGKPTKRIEQFDPQAEQIILVPRVVGG
jgi:hypothetical protein